MKNKKLIIDATIDTDIADINSNCHIFINNIIQIIDHNMLPINHHHIIAQIILINKAITAINLILVFSPIAIAAKCMDTVQRITEIINEIINIY